uniref:THAP-type domain-containing protein n=1 Tax=Amphimedon queenslandica TaxID=400682 RepID=A0A1X7TQ31_AMPQE
MVRPCIVGGCSNTTRDGISLHKFPSNILTRRQWILKVKKTRADWKKPSAFSEVCSDHFSEDCFESIADKLGLRMKRILKPNAIPTIFKSRPYNKTKSRTSTALQKRERARTVSATDMKRWNMKQMVKVMHLLVYLKLISPLKMMAILLRLFAIMNCACISEATFYSRQMKYLRQAVSNVWKEHQNSMLTVLQVEKKPLILGGDGRCDSPGFSTKNGSYTFLEIEHNVVLNIELVQSNEVSGSTNMEKECFMRGMKIFEVYDLPIKMLVTDRHKQLGKYIREDLPQIDHKFDVWHIAKSFRKKVKKLAKRKGCEEVGSWIKRMVNHLYWAAMSSEDGDPEMILEKWLSLRRHIHNKHHGHGTKYKKCAHGRLRKRRWLKYNTKQSDQLLSVINNIRLCSDTSKLSNSYQTSCLEAFHSLINQYAPKHAVVWQHSIKITILAESKPLLEKVKNAII